MSLAQDLQRSLIQLDRDIKRAERRGSNAAKKALSQALREERARFPRKTGKAAKAYKLRARIHPDGIRFTLKNAAFKWKSRRRDYYAEHINQGQAAKALLSGLEGAVDEATQNLDRSLKEALRG